MINETWTDKCFEEKNLCRVCQETRKFGRKGRLTKQNEAWSVSADFDVWLEIRAELEKSIVEQKYRQILAIQAKLSRYAQEDKHCIHLMVFGEIVSNPAKTSKMEVLILINEDMRTVPRELCVSCDFYWQ